MIAFTLSIFSTATIAEAKQPNIVIFLADDKQQSKLHLATPADVIFIEVQRADAGGIIGVGVVVE